MQGFETGVIEINYVDAFSGIKSVLFVPFRDTNRNWRLVESSIFTQKNNKNTYKHTHTALLSYLIYGTG